MPNEPQSSRQFRVGKNPDSASRLAYVLQLPVAGEPPLNLACRVDWPYGKDAYCHPVDEWPEDAEIVHEVPVERCWRAGKAVHLVLRRRARRRSLFVWTKSRGRDLIFWRTQATMSAARPGLKVPEARGLDAPIPIAVDVREHHPWRFGKQKARLTRRELPVGDYGVFHGNNLRGVVERKSPANLAGDAVAGRLAFSLAELEQVPHACLVVEGRLSDVLKAPKGNVRPGWLLSVLAALQVQHPRVPWLFAETRALAEDYAYRWLAAVIKKQPHRSVAERSGPRTRDSAPDPADAGRAPSQPDEYGTGGPATPDTQPVRKSSNVARPAAYQPPLVVRDRTARLTEAMDLARTGRTWTTADYAEHFRVSRSTAYTDLARLVEAGSLVAEGSTRARRYRLAE